MVVRWTTFSNTLNSYPGNLNNGNRKNGFFYSLSFRVFLFHEGDKGSRESASVKGLAKIFQKAVIEATAAFKIWMQAMESKDQIQQERSDKKPPPYKHIKVGLVIV